MNTLPPLSMSQTKDDLLKHLNLHADTYTLMSKETDRVYKWLTADKHHLKKNSKRKPPYDWSDINEKAKDEAMTRIAGGGNEYTNYYWNLAPSGVGDCPNWIARWFLYHKFRYRDGRNKNAKDSDNMTSSHSHGSGSRHSHHNHAVVGSGQMNDYYGTQTPGYNASGLPSFGTSSAGYYATGTTQNQGSFAGYNYNYNYSSNYNIDSQSNQTNQDGEEDDGKSGYYDPVRDV